MPTWLLLASVQNDAANVAIAFPLIFGLFKARMTNAEIISAFSLAHQIVLHAHFGKIALPVATIIGRIVLTAESIVICVLKRKIHDVAAVHLRKHLLCI